jgi:hypothetical protein
VPPYRHRVRHLRFLLFIPVLLTSLMASGCGAAKQTSATDSTDPNTSDPTSNVAQTPTYTGTSPECELAVKSWVRAARNQYYDAAFEVPFTHPTATARPANRIDVYCDDDELSRAVREANYELALLNAGLTVCQNVPANCDRRGNDEQFEKAKQLVESVADA